MRDKLLPTTGIGSLPHTDIFEAVAFSKRFDIPFLPELTSIEDSREIQKIEDFKCYAHFIDEVKSETLFKTQSFFDLAPVRTERQIHFIDDPLKIFKDTHSSLGLHCCNRLSVEDIKKLAISHLSFDAGLITSPRVFIRTLLEKGITPVVGVIKTSDSRIEFCDNIDAWRAVLREFVTECWISPACGLAGFTTEDCETALEMMQTLKREILYSHL